MPLRLTLLTILLLTLNGCGNLGLRDGGPNQTFNHDSVAEIEPRMEPLSPGGNPESYSINGEHYRVMKGSQGFVEQGVASWYGTKFHGNKTSNGERYDMYVISAAHKTLPIPTYVEVTNLENGRRLIVRVNDRGPFHSGRIIDLSYAAAAKLGYADKGTAQVEIRAIDVAQYQRERFRTVPSHPTPQVTVTPLQNSVASIIEQATPLPMVEYTEGIEESAATLQSTPPQGGDAPSPAASRQPANGDIATAAVKGPFYIQLGAYSSLANAEQMVEQTQLAEISSSGPATIMQVTNNSRVIYRVRLGPFKSRSAAARILQYLIQKSIGEPRIFHDS